MKKNTRKIVTKKTKKQDIDSDFFRFDDDYDTEEKYTATPLTSEVIEQKQEVFTTKTTYEVENSGDSILIKKKNNKDMLLRLNKIARIILKVVVVISVLIIIDLFLITRFEFGPLFAIRTKTYKDGGTKEY